MVTYQDIKSKPYLKQMLCYAEEYLNCRFRRSSKDRYSAHCPFHADTKDSFRVYVDEKDEVRFKCFGACSKGADKGKLSWDIYDLIMLREKCRFKKAQRIWADYLGIRKFKPFDGKSENVPDPGPEPDTTVEFISPQLDQDVISLMTESAHFYNSLLLSKPERFGHVYDYLEKRGVELGLIQKFIIGYAPPYDDEHYLGRALIQEFYPRFKANYRTFNPFVKCGLIRLLNDMNSPGYGFFRRQINFTTIDPFITNHGDRFAGRIIFPIQDSKSQVIGFIGRRPDNRGLRWMKQQSQSGIEPKSWLFGIEKAYRHIQQYQTVILVEGIFDYFAFYKLFQDQDKPLVVSTLGSTLTQESMEILKNLGAEHFIVAFDWDQAGKKGIQRVASQVGARVHYLGGLKEGQDPAKKLKDVSTIISGFSLKHLLIRAKRDQKKAGKPVNIHLTTSGKLENRDVVFEATWPSHRSDKLKGREPREFFYNIDEFLPLLTYNHSNQTMLKRTLVKIGGLLERHPTQPEFERTFTLPVGFLRAKSYEDLGPALILWIRLVIEQQTRKRKIRETDETIAGWLKTSRATVNRYKGHLHELGYLKIDCTTRPQRMTVSYFPKTTPPLIPDPSSNPSPPMKNSGAYLKG